MSGLFDDKHLLDIYYIACTMPNWEEKKAQRNNILPTSLNRFYFIKGGRYLNSKMQKKKNASVL